MTLLTHQYQDSSNLDARIDLHERFSTSKQLWLRWVFDHFDFGPGCRILELGCGPGNLWRDNADRIDPSWAITLSDFSTGMLERAQERLAGIDAGFQFRLFDATSIPFGDGVFDVVIANHMLYHVPDLDRTLAEVRRVLEPGGRLYAATNGVNHMRELDDLMPDFMPHRPSGEVIAQFTLENGRASLERFFPDVTLDRMPNALLITEAAPLIGYIMSRTSIVAAGAAIDDRQRRAFAEHIEAELREHGGTIRITKDSGLFIASKH